MRNGMLVLPLAQIDTTIRGGIGWFSYRLDEGVA